MGPDGPRVVPREEEVQVGLVVAFLEGELVAAVEAAGVSGGAEAARRIGDLLAERGVVVAAARLESPLQ